jgi:hypothetical protein
MLKKLVALAKQKGIIAAVILMRIPKNMCQYYADMAMYMMILDECQFICWLCKTPVPTSYAPCSECGSWSSHHIRLS